MVSVKRTAARMLFGSRYNNVPWGQRVYVRPGERLMREAQWRLKLRSARVMSLEEYKATVPLGEIEEFLSCMMCGDSRQQPLFEPTGGRNWRYHVVRCPSCGFLYRNPKHQARTARRPVRQLLQQLPDRQVRRQQAAPLPADHGRLLAGLRARRGTAAARLRLRSRPVP
ncbi:hypothetical protein [Nonomuraea dietziae]|uniref:hypothetical protein n=1 Tax=Nonomuraea dietziae TaxID=65515 RepID=UPI0031E10DAC